MRREGLSKGQLSREEGRTCPAQGASDAKAQRTGEQLCGGRTAGGKGGRKGPMVNMEGGDARPRGTGPSKELILGS